MRRRSGVFAACCSVAVLATGAAGCAVVDQYAGRAVVYNVEAEQTLQKALLLNVVRASLRRPMQFTGLQSIVGTASATGSVSPTSFLGPHPASAMRSGTLTGGLSGGQTFTVPVLDTQEFYDGILGPIKGQLLDFYLQAGYPRQLIYDLFIGKIVMKRTDPECPASRHSSDCEIVFSNTVGNDLQFDLFQAVVDHLIVLGLGTEALPQKDKNAGGSAQGNTGGTAAKKKTDSSDSKDDTAPKDIPYRLCFAPNTRAKEAFVRPISRCGGLDISSGKAAQLKLSGEINKTGNRASLPSITLSGSFVDRLIAIRGANTPEIEIGQRTAFKDLDRFRGRLVTFSLYTRSTEGVIYYVGEVVRRQLYPDFDPTNRRFIQVKAGDTFREFPEKPCNGQEGNYDPNDPSYNGFVCRSLFVVDHDAVNVSLTVDYEGSRYSIPADSSAFWSLPVLELMKQLLAVNTSARSLPATSVLSIVGGQ